MDILHVVEQVLAVGIGLEAELACEGGKGGLLDVLPVSLRQAWRWLKHTLKQISFNTYFTGIFFNVI